MSGADEHREHTVQNAGMSDEFRVTHTIKLEEEVREYLRRIVEQLEDQ